MFLRCERCRAVYELDAPAGQVVGCRHCGHVFKARALSNLGHPGVIGGAAAENRASPEALPQGALQPLDARDPVAWPSPSPWSDPDDAWGALGKGNKTLVIVAGLLVAGAVAAAAMKAGTSRPKIAAVPVDEISVAVDEASSILWRDDEASLEQAIARFARATSLAPDRAEPRAWQALAITLLGDALACEVEELAFEARWLEQRLGELGQDDDRRAALEARHAELGVRLGVVEPRSRRLLTEGHDLGLAAWSAEGMHERLVAIRAMALVHAVAANAPEVERLVELLDVSQQADPWLLYARARAQAVAALSGEAFQHVNAALATALAAKPGFERALWQLGRLALLAGPEHLDSARQRFEQLMAANDHHEGARRGLRRVAVLAGEQPHDADLARLAVQR